MLLCPEHSQTSPTSTSLTVTVSSPSVNEIEEGEEDWGPVEISTFQLPSLPAVVFVTLSVHDGLITTCDDGLADPHSDAFSADSNMPSDIIGGNVTFADI